MRCLILTVLFCISTNWALPLTFKGKVLPFKNLGSRIINGESASEGQFPWQVAVWIEGRAFCGGSLINEEWILTAGHCVDGAEWFTIVLGTIYSRLDDDGPLRIGSRASVLHEGFKGDWDNADIGNDIALIQLAIEVQFTDRIRPIALTSEEVKPGTDVTVSGWGKETDASSSISPTLKFVSLRTISNEECVKTFGGIIGPEVVCANHTNKDLVQSTCNGDSGGPIVIDLDIDEPKHVAIVSFGSDDGCESGAPAGFTRSAYYRTWIKDFTGI